ARIDLGASEADGRTIERVDPAWISAVAAIPESSLGSLTGRWIDRIEEELGELPRQEKPWIRELAGRVVAFCRTADRGDDGVFVWELRHEQGPPDLRVTRRDPARSRGLVRRQPATLGRLDGGARRGRVLRRGGLPGGRRARPAVRDRGPGRRDGQDAAP